MSTTSTIPKQKMSAVIDGLKVLLADTYALMAQTQFAHWNVQGSNFFQLHAAFQHQYEELFEAVDLLAERLRALDVLAPGGLRTLAKAAKIKELPVEPAGARTLVEHLIEGHQSLVSDAFALRKAADDAGDLETQDMIIKRVQDHQTTLWMLQSFLKKSAG